MKALDLLRKLPSQFPGPTIAYPLTNFTNDKLKKVKQSPYTESLDIDVKLADDVIRIIENCFSRNHMRSRVSPFRSLIRILVLSGFWKV